MAPAFPGTSRATDARRPRTPRTATRRRPSRAQRPYIRASHPDRMENLLESPQTNRDLSTRGRTHGSRTVTAAEKAQAREVSLRRIGHLFTPYRWQLAIVTAIIAASA